MRRLSKEFVENYKDKSPPWGPVGYITYKRTYSRYIEEENRTEEWFETIERCVNGILSIGGKFTKEEAEKLYDHVFNLRCSFSGRALWQLGTKTVDRIGGDSLQNCWCVKVNNPIKPFCFTFNELMLGGGVGFNILPEYVYELPEVKYCVNIERLDSNDVDFIVPDNREGWVQLLSKTLKAFYFNGKNLTYSTNCIRPRGRSIKCFGGVASGSEELVKGISKIATILQSRYTQKLRPIDCLDIMNIIGSVVVAGNVRRSAEIAIGSPTDQLFLNAKNWNIQNVPNHRAMSNNSIIINDITELPQNFWERFKEEGEPIGLINLSTCRHFGRVVDGQGLHRADPHVIGTNPCIAKGSFIATADGRGSVKVEQLYKEFQEKKDIILYAWNAGEDRFQVEKAGKVSLTRKRTKTIKVSFDDNSNVVVTKDHLFLLSDGKYKETTNLKIGNSIRAFSRVYINGRTSQEIIVNHGRSRIDFESHLIGEFLSKIPIQKFGGRSGESIIVHHENGNHLDNSVENLKVMSYGKHSSIEISGDRNPMRRFPEKNLFRDKEWQRENNLKHHLGVKRLKKVGRNISIAKIQGFKRRCKEIIDTLENFSMDLTEYNWKKVKEGWFPKHYPNWNTYRKYFILNHRIVRIEEGDEKDVYDIMMPQFSNFVVITKEFEQLNRSKRNNKYWNGIVVHNCGEIPLESYEPCNLAEIFLPNIKNTEILTEVVGLMYYTCKTISQLPFIYKETNEVTRRNQRIGIGISGYMESKFRENKKVFNDLYSYLKDLDSEYSKKLGVHSSIKLTTIKPSGTLSLLAGVTSGAHLAYAPYYIRRIRMSSNDPLVALCRKKGYQIEPILNFDGTYDMKVMVVSFPIKESTSNAIFSKKVSAVDQLETLKWLQTYWSDNSVSITIYYRKSEVSHIKKWLEENYSVIKSVSFLLHKEHGFNQPPLEEISKEQYEEMIANTEPILKIEDVEETEFEELLECEGVCPIK